MTVMGTVKNIQNSYINITCAFKYQSEEICKKSRKIRIHGQTDPDLQSGLLSEGTTYLFKCLQVWIYYLYQSPRKAEVG